MSELSVCQETFWHNVRLLLGFTHVTDMGEMEQEIMKLKYSGEMVIIKNGRMPRMVKQ